MQGWRGRRTVRVAGDSVVGPGPGVPGGNVLCTIKFTIFSQCTLACACIPGLQTGCLCRAVDIRLQQCVVAPAAAHMPPCALSRCCQPCQLQPRTQPCKVCHAGMPALALVPAASALCSEPPAAWLRPRTESEPAAEVLLTAMQWRSPGGGAHARAPAAGSGWVAGSAPNAFAAPAGRSVEHAAGRAQGMELGPPASGTYDERSTRTAADNAAEGALMPRAQSADVAGAAAALQQRRAAKRPAAPGARTAEAAWKPGRFWLEDPSLC